MQFFLEIEDGRVVFLRSQEFYDDERYESGLPSELTMTRLPLSGELLGFQTSGYEPVLDHPHALSALSGAAHLPLLGHEQAAIVSIDLVADDFPGIVPLADATASTRGDHTVTFPEFEEEEFDPFPGVTDACATGVSDCSLWSLM